MPARLLRRLAPLLALLAVVATSCGSVSEPAALTVKGEEITADSVQDEIEAIQANAGYRAQVEQQSGPLAGTGKGTFSAAFAAETLTFRTYFALIEDWLEEQGERVTDADEQAMREQLTQQDVFNDFNEAYQDRLVHQQALVTKASEVAAQDVDVACVSHILVTTESRTEAEAAALADSLKAQLDGGADFAELARANSEDPGSKDAGGDLGCQPAGVYDPDFEEAVFDQEVGEVGEPVKTQFGYHLIVVESRDKGAEPDTQAGQQAFSTLILELSCDEDLDISVDPKYGTWDRSPCDESQLAKVTPPRGPKSS